MLNPGDRFGDYTVVRLLGKGGMGAVYLLKTAEGGQVAAKILDPAMADDHESRKRFLREAEFALGVKHPNLVETYDVGEDPDTGLCYILMEYVSGGSLSDYLKEHGALSIDDAVAVVEAMAQVLELARQRGIVHRDIKPANIMFDAEGTPKLADLGIARGGLLATNTTTVTQTGMMIGTPAYMAPEQMLDAHNVDTRADIYSLGVVFYEMLTGERPNKDDTVVQLMAKAVKGEPLPDVRTLRPEVSASLAQLLAMMVVPDKDGRIATPGQITNALDIIARGGTLAAKPAAAPAETKKRRNPFPWKALIPVGILAGLAAAFVILAPKRESAKAPQTEPVVKAEIRTLVRTNVIERIVERKAEDKPGVVETAALRPGSGKHQEWRLGPNEKWFVSWDEALDDARERKRPILVLNTGSSWCHWCKKLREEVLDQDAFRAFADEHLTLLCLDSPCENVDQRNHNRQVVRALKFGGGVPNVRVFTPDGKFLGSVGGGGLAVDAYVAKLRDVLDQEGTDQLDADGRMLFADGYAALAAKIAEERAKLPKVAKSDFKAKLVGVAVVSDDNRSRWNLNAAFLPPETRVEVPFGKTALFKVEYDFPEGYGARVWTRDEWSGEHRRNSSFFGSNPSGLYKGKGVTTGFLSLLSRGKGCNLKSLAIRTSSEPEIDDETREWKIGSFPVDVVFKEKDAGAAGDSSPRRSSTPPGWLDDLEAAKERARAEKKLILAAFEGSDWCGWCKKMEKDVYAKTEFMPTVSPRFVPVYIDMPHDRSLLREAVCERNPALHGKYGIRGVPCVLILDAEGKELGRVGGYKKDVGALMERINAIPGVPREMIKTAGGLVDPESLNDPDSTRAVQKALDALFPGWKVQGIKPAQADDAEWQSGFVSSWRGLRNVVATHPPSGERPTVMSRTVRVPQHHPVLLVETASQSKDADFMLSVKVNGRMAFGPHVVCTPDEHPYERLVVPLARWRGKQVKIEIEHSCNGWFYEHAFWSKLEIVEGSGKEAAGPVGVVRTEVFPRANPSSFRWKKRAPWLYVTEAPAAEWKDCGFDDRKWKRTVKAFGDDRPPAHMSVAQAWKSDRIWMRRKFDWNGSTDIYKVELDLYYDQDVEIFLNGREVARRDGWNTEWIPQCIDSHAFAGALRRGENVLAVTLKGNSGGSYFDCGLSIETPDGDAEVEIPGQSSIDPKKLYHDDTTKAVQKTLNVLFPGWKTSANRARNKGTSSVVGYVADYRGKRDLVCTLPPDENEPMTISRRMRLPTGRPALRLSVCKNMTYQADFLLQVLVDGKKVHEEPVNNGKWHQPVVDLSEWAGRDVKIEIRQYALKGNAWGRAYWSKIAVE